MKLLIFILLLQSCSTCFSIDGRAYSSCLGRKRYTEKCKNHGGLNYHLGDIKGVCNDGTEFKD